MLHTPVSKISLPTKKAGLTTACTRLLCLLLLLGLTSLRAQAAERLTSIFGTVWNDANANHILDANESFVGSVTVTLYDAQGKVYDTTTTDGDVGFYGFLGIPAGVYTVVETVPVGWSASNALPGGGFDANNNPIVGGGTVFVNDTTLKVNATVDQASYVNNDFLITLLPSATFVKTDSTTQGSWKGVYGSQGYNVIGDTTSYPAYADVSVIGNAAYTWAGSTSDARCLVKANASDRIASCWYSDGAFTLDVNLTDGNAHQVSLQLMDWENASRCERITILDAATHAVLDTQNASAFALNSKYLVWNLTGHVLIQISWICGSNAVLSGIFFD
jgi:hypothetical protein